MKLLVLVLLLALLPYYVQSDSCKVASARNDDVNAGRMLNIYFDSDEDNDFKIESNSIDQSPTNRTQWTLEVNTADEGEFDLHYVRTVKGSDNNMINQFWIRIERIVEYIKGNGTKTGSITNNNINNWQYEPGVDTVGFDYEMTEVKFKKYGPGPMGNYTFVGTSTDDVYVVNINVFTSLTEALINDTKMILTPSMINMELLVNISRIGYYQLNDSRVALLGKIWSRDEVISSSNTNSGMSASTCIGIGPSQKPFGFFDWFNLLLVGGTNQTADQPNYHVAPLWLAPILKNNSDTGDQYDNTTPFVFYWSLQDIQPGFMDWKTFIGIQSFGETGTSVSAAGSIYAFRFELSLICSILLLIFLF